MTLIPPTVGRVVLFHPGMDTPGQFNDAQPFNAHVVYVHNDRLINIAYNDHAGACYHSQGVQLVQEGDPQPLDGEPYANWMPYQIGQAKKHEEALAVPTQQPPA